MRIASRDLRVVSVGLVSAVLLVGCSGNSSKPTVIPALTLSNTPTVATTPAPAPSTTPAAATSATSLATTSTSTVAAPTTATAMPTSSAPATQPIAKTVSDFIKAYYRAANASLKDNRALPIWRGMFSASCTVCVGDYEAISKERRAGARYVGGTYALKSVQVENVNRNGANVHVSYVLPAVKLISKSGKLLDSSPATIEKQATISVSIKKQLLAITYIENAGGLHAMHQKDDRCVGCSRRAMHAYRARRNSTSIDVPA